MTYDGIGPWRVHGAPVSTVVGELAVGLETTARSFKEWMKLAAS